MIEEIFEKALQASKENKLEEAEKLYRECLKIRQTPEVWNNLGNVYARMERFAEAVECYRKSIDCDPVFTVAYVNLASLLINLERFAEARLVLLSLMEREKPNEQILAMLIVCDLALNNLAEAVDLYKKNFSEALKKELSEYGVLEKLLSSD